MCFSVRLKWKYKMNTLASDWLKFFSTYPALQPLNRIQQNLTGSKCTQCPLPSLCFWDQPENQDGHLGYWLAGTFSTYPLQPLNRFQRNLTGSSTSSTRFMFFGQIGNARWSHWPLIGWNIFDFSAIDEQTTRLDEVSTQCPLPSLCFSVGSENQGGSPGLWLAETFQHLLCNRRTKFQRHLTGGSTSSAIFVGFFFRKKKTKTKWPYWPVIGRDIFNLSSATAEDLNVFWQVRVFRTDRKIQDDRPGFWLAKTFSTSQLSTKLDRKLKVLYKVCVFQSDLKSKMAALASDWLKHFRLFCN